MNTEEAWTWADWVYKENHDSSFVSFTEKEPIDVTGRIGFLKMHLFSYWFNLFISAKFLTHFQQHSDLDFLPFPLLHYHTITLIFGVPDNW